MDNANTSFPWKDRISIVVPAKDEGQNIGDIIKSCLAYSNDILVVDGHSKDDTGSIATSLGARLIYDGGKGKGEALRCSIPHVRNDIVVFIDADGSHDPNDIPRLVAPLIDNQYDHVTGSRLTGGSSELHGGFDEFLRLTGSSFITACINWRFKVRLSDSQNGFRAIKTTCLKSLTLTEDSTTIEQQMIIRTLKKGFRMGEVPAHEYTRRHGVSHIRLSRDWWKYGLSLIKELISVK